MNNLIELWERVLGTTPSEQQFLIWTESHPSDVVRQGILKTAMKNQQLGGAMTEDHKVRFASKVMLTVIARREEHAANREKLHQECGKVVAESNPQETRSREQ
jgi:hypothetical protein